MKKLTTAEACFYLFGGAYICVSHYPDRKRPLITVCNPDVALFATLGIITEKQFEEIDRTGLVIFSRHRTDKYGTIHNVYDFYNEPGRVDF